MAGKRCPDNTDFITDRADYREVNAIDPSVEDSAIPILDTKASPHLNMGTGQSDSSWYGRNAQIDMAVIPNGPSSVTVEAWLKAEVERKELIPAGGSSSSSAASLPVTEDWVKVAEKTFTGPELWIIENIPPGKYKFRVSAMTGAGSVVLREQHAA